MNSHISVSKFILKAELQRQNKLISSDRPLKNLQIQTKIIKIGQAVLEILHFQDEDLDNFTRKKDKKNPENVVFRGFAQTEEQ